MRKKIHIRGSVAGDGEKIADIEEKSFKDPWTRKFLIEDVEKNPLNHYLLAEVDGLVVGYLGFNVVLDEAELLKIAVDIDYRGKGVGKKLLNAFISYASYLGAEKIFLEVRKSNFVAKKLYEDRGFDKIYTRENYYSDGEDADVMELILAI